MSVATRLVRNSVFSAAGRLWGAATTFFLMPYMLYRLGENGLGVYQMLLLLLTYFAYADAGMSTALPKYVAQHAAREDREALQDVVNTGVAFYAALAALGVVLSLVFAGAYLRLIRTPPEMTAEATLSFYFIIAVTGFTFAVLAFRGILTGLHRMDIIVAVEVVVSVPILFATIWVLATGHGLLGMAIVQFAQFAAIGAGIIYYSVRLLPGIRINPFRASRSCLVELLGYWKVAAPAASLMLQGQAERLFLSGYLGPGAVALYSFGAKISEAWRNAVYPALTAVVPTASHLDATDTGTAVKALYERGTRFVLATVYPIGMWLFAITPIFITVWMGNGEGRQFGHGHAMLAMRLVLVGTMLQLTTGVCVAVARGLGRLKPDFVASALMVAVELVLGVVLAHRMGYRGILLAGVAAFAVNGVTVIAMVHASFNWPLLPALLRLYLPPLAVSLAAAAPLFWYNHAHRMQIITSVELKPRLEMAGLGIVETAVYFVIYAGLILGTRYIVISDVKSLVRAVVKR